MAGSSLGIKIESDFKDYYDYLSINSNYAGVYKRYRTKESRGKLLRWLKEQGINTIELKAAREFSDTAKNLVIYTNPNLHESQGKKVVTIDEARTMYANNLASKFYEEANGETLKVLQVGSRRFRIVMKNDTKFSLSGGNVVSITELASELNYSIMQPIFSIDYITNGKEMLAIDFNVIQKLDTLGLQSFMSPEQVITEVKKSLIAYNKL